GCLAYAPTPTPFGACVFVIMQWSQRLSWKGTVPTVFLSYPTLAVTHAEDKGYL
ncbi:hypothetical protein Tco_1046506, partial [Tanacetum coccineum]